MPSRKTSDKMFLELTSNVDAQALGDSVKNYFAQFPDPRSPERRVYPAWYVLLVLICGYLAGCNTIADIAHYAELRTDWFNGFLGTTFRSISYDTLWWFLARVRPEAFQQLLADWLKEIPSDLRNQLFAIDGKRLRGVSDNEHITHLVELFAVEGRLVIAQEQVPDKKCERKALHGLLKTVDITGAIISMDAHYTYAEDLHMLLQQGADYLVGIKGNQGNLAAEVRNYFEQAREIQYASEEFQCCTTSEKGHGRIETRHVCVSCDLDWLPQREIWGLKTLIEVRSERIIGNRTEQAIRYYGSSRAAGPEQFAKWIRGHWGIESLHYVLDVVFREDSALAQAGHAAENMSLLRRLSMNIVRVFDPDRGMADARRCATYEPLYLRGLLLKVFIRNR